LDTEKVLEKIEKWKKLKVMEKILLFDATQWSTLSSYSKKSSDQFTSHQKKKELASSNNSDSKSKK
jgi:hypothetical protein